MHFDKYIGIDYSGAGTCDSPQGGLKIFQAEKGQEPLAVLRETGSEKYRNWSRKSLTQWLRDTIMAEGNAVIGIDHCFSLPEDYFTKFGLQDWNALLNFLSEKWPCHLPGVKVEEFRPEIESSCAGKRFRRTELWTSGAKSIFSLNVNGQVGKSSFSGLPWLKWLRDSCGDRIHFWPFDGFAVPEGKTVIAEVYPSILSRRYEFFGDNPHERDAFSIAKWLQDMDEKGFLGRYFHPPLTEKEAGEARKEGWILGVA